MSPARSSSRPTPSAAACASPEERARALVYHFEVGVPGSNDLRAARAEFIPGRDSPAVFLDGPYCLRHRWSDDSLCMWTPEDGPENRWVLSDGLPRMAEHIALHAFCEGECRAGKPWPKAEGPGEHLRKRACPSCRGRGR